MRPNRHYTDRECREIVACAEVLGYAETRRRYRVTTDAIWALRKRDRDGMRRTVPDEKKVSAALYYLLNGDIAGTAKKFGVSIAALSEWHRGRDVNEDVRVMIDAGRQILAAKGKKAAEMIADGFTPVKVSEASIGELAGAFKKVVEAVDRLEDRPPPSDMFAALSDEERRERAMELLREAMVLKQQAEAPALLDAPPGNTYVMNDDGTLTEV